MFTGTGRPEALLIILLASSILQFAAAFLAVRLVRHTGRRLSWLLIAVAIIGMTMRRLLGLAEAVPAQPGISDYVFEWIGLGVSALLLAGVALIKPLFLSIRETSDKLARSKAMYEELVQSASSLILRLTPEGRITFVNEYACRYLGVAPEDLLDNDVCEVLHAKAPQGQDAPPLSNLFVGHLEPMMRFECEVRRADGSPTWVGWASSPARDLDGRIREYLCVGLDINDRKEKERLREDVQGILRHDLKSPLAGIISLASALRTTGNLDEEQVEGLEAMEDSATRLLEMINRDQDIYKLETGLYAMHPAPVDMAAVARNVAASQARQTEGRAHILLTVDGQPDHGGAAAPIQGDEMLLYSMLTNLVRNALEASGSDLPATVSLTTGPELVLSVHNAQAVPEDFQPRFFEKFATRGKRFGTGLGTYSAKLIAEAHHGSIALHSSETDGTTVTVRLPASPPASDSFATP